MRLSRLFFPFFYYCPLVSFIAFHLLLAQKESVTPISAMHASGWQVKFLPHIPRSLSYSEQHPRRSNQLHPPILPSLSLIVSTTPSKDDSLVAKAPGLGALARDGSDDSCAVPGALDQMIALLVAGRGWGVRVLHEGDGVGALVLDLAGAKGVWWGRG